MLIRPKENHPPVPLTPPLLVPQQEEPYAGAPVIAFSPGTLTALQDEAVSSQTQLSCRNCGKTFPQTAYCPHCGQENVTIAVPVKTLLADMGEEFIKWDGRLLRTLYALLFRPGKFTREYLQGRRKQYLSPFKMYFVVSTLFFLVLGWKHPLDKELNINNKEGIHIGFDSKPGSEKASKRRALTGENLPNVMGTELFPKKYKLNGQPVTAGHFVEAFDEWQKGSRNKNKQDKLHRLFSRQVLKLLDNPGTYVAQLPQTIGKAMFFLLPVYALLLSFLFYGARRYFIEHLVFAVNVHTVSFVIVTVVTLLPDANAWILPKIGLILSFWVHEIIALKTVYGQHLGLTLFKQWMLNNMYFVAVLFGIIIAAIVAIFFL